MMTNADPINPRGSSTREDMHTKMYAGALKKHQNTKGFSHMFMRPLHREHHNIT